MSVSLEAKEKKAHLGGCKKLTMTGILSVRKEVEHGPKMKLEREVGVRSYRVLCAGLGNSFFILRAIKTIEW